MFASYAKATRVRILASVVGQEGLTEIDRRYLAFADRFERELVAQDTARSLDDTLALGWLLLADLPREELARLSDAQMVLHLPPCERAATGQSDGHG